MISAAKYSEKCAALEAENSQLKTRIEELMAQVKWFQKQIFGRKSERRIEETPKEQLF